MATTNASLTVAEAIASRQVFVREVRNWTDPQTNEDKILVLFAQGYGKQHQGKGLNPNPNQYPYAPVVVAISYTVEDFEASLPEDLVDVLVPGEFNVKPSKGDWKETYLMEDEAVLASAVFADGCEYPIHMVEVLEDENGDFIHPITGKASKAPRPMKNPETDTELTSGGKRIMRFTWLGEDAEAPQRERKQRDKVEETAAASTPAATPQVRQRQGLRATATAEN